MTTDSPEASPRNVGRLAAFHYRDFRLFWISLFVSNIGTWMQMTATNWLLYQLTNSPMQLGLNGIFRAVPLYRLRVVQRHSADRYDRRWLLLWTQLILAFLSFGLAVLDQSGSIQTWQIYAFTFISASVGSFDGPARQSLFPSLVPRAVLPNAVALNSLLWKGAALLGPTLGGIAISVMETSGAFYANGASFLVVVVALLLMRTASPMGEKRHEFFSEKKRGISLHRFAADHSRADGDGSGIIGVRPGPCHADDLGERRVSCRRARIWLSPVVARSGRGNRLEFFHRHGPPAG